MSINEKGRPRAESGLPDDGQNVEASVTRGLVTEVAEMLADCAERERRIERAAYREGYENGFIAGREAGAARAEVDMARAWSHLARRIRGLASSLPFVELERRRWDGRREDFGKARPGDYAGGPVEWSGAAGPGRGAA